jgi:hypothetical protein
LIAFLPLAGGLFIRYAGFEITFISVAVLMLGSSLLVPRNHPAGTPQDSEAQP